jgi:hypothetical protein
MTSIIEEGFNVKEGCPHTAYSVTAAFAVYVPPGWYAAEVAVLLVAQPRKM